jgi:hypothetical protein
MPEYTPIDLSNNVSGNTPNGVTSTKQAKVAAVSQSKQAKHSSVPRVPNSLQEFAADKPNITLDEIMAYEDAYAKQVRNDAALEEAKLGNAIVRDTDNVMGALSNLGIQFGAGVARTASNIAASPFEAASIATQRTVNQAERDAYGTAEAKKLRLGGDAELTAEEQAVYEPQVIEQDVRSRTGEYGDQFQDDLPTNLGDVQSVYGATAEQQEYKDNVEPVATEKTTIATDTSAADKLDNITDVQKYITEPKQKFQEFIRSHVNTKGEDKLIADLGDVYDESLKDFEDGDYAKGAAKLVAGGIGSNIKNPVATLGFLAESLPQMLATSIRGPANIAYAMDTATKGIEKFTEDNNRAPTRREINQIMGISASAAAAEQLGASKLLPGAKAASKAKKAVTAVKDTVTNVATEAATEGYQTTAEQLAGTLDIAKVDGKEVYTAAAIGGGVAGAIETGKASKAATNNNQNQMTTLNNLMRAQADNRNIATGGATPTGEEYVAANGIKL